MPLADAEVTMVQPGCDELDLNLKGHGVIRVDQGRDIRVLRQEQLGLGVKREQIHIFLSAAAAEAARPRSPP